MAGFLKKLLKNSITSKGFMEKQRHDFSDSTPRAGSDRLEKSAKSLLSALQLKSISQISTQNKGQVISTLFKSQENFDQ